MLSGPGLACIDPKTCTLLVSPVPLTVVIVVGRRSVGTHPIPVINQALHKALPEALISVLSGVGAGLFCTQIEITNDGAHVPWSVSVAIQQCVFLPSKKNDTRHADHSSIPPSSRQAAPV